MAVTNRTAIKEYIGARYVPLFYDDGQGGAEWTADEQYEPLTIVTYQGNSYTSRQYVPEGINILNTRYWLQTGNWNSQIEQYRTEVLQFDGRITANAEAITAEGNTRSHADDVLQLHIEQAEDRESTARQNADAALQSEITENFTNKSDRAGYSGGVAIGFGDSILAGRFCDTPATQSPLAIMASDLGMTSKNYAVNHGAFTRSSASGYRIRDQITTAIEDSLLDHDNVRLVILEGGVNDANDNAVSGTVVSEVSGCLTAIKSAWPNARIVVLPVLQGCMGFSYYPDQNRNIVYTAIVEACRAQGVYYAKFAFQWGIGRATWAADYLHPNVAGSAGYGHGITLEVLGIAYTYDPIAHSQTSAFELLTADTGRIRAHNGKIDFSGIWRATQAFNANDTLLRLPAWACMQKDYSVPIVAYKHGSTWEPILLTINTELLDLSTGTSGVTLRTSMAIDANETVWIPPYSFTMGM